MSTSTFFISKDSLRFLKSTANRLSKNSIASSHLSEGIAAALGFKTYAALRMSLNKQNTVEVPKPDNKKLTERLYSLGYTNLSKESHLLPEFTYSHTSFKTFPLRTRFGIRWIGWRNIIISAINAGLEQQLFGLSPTDNWWPGASPDPNKSYRYTFWFQFNDTISAIASIDANTGDEISISVILNPKRSDINPQFFDGFSDGDAFAYGWLERRLGAWIQDGGEGFSCRRSLLPKIATTTIEPKGYADQGPFIM